MIRFSYMLFNFYPTVLSCSKLAGISIGLDWISKISFINLKKKICDFSENNFNSIFFKIQLTESVTKREL